MTLISANDLDTSPVEQLADGIIPRLGVGIMWGPSTAGKSLVALDLALAVANGTPFLGRNILHPGRVAYALGEGLSGMGVRKQARLARQAADDAQATALGEAVAAYTGDNLAIVTEPFVMDFDRADREQQFERLAQALKSANQ